MSVESESATKEDVQIGDEMDDGTILAGISPDTGEKMFTTPADAPGTYSFNQAAEYAKNLVAYGHHDFHPPSIGQLNVLYENRNQGKLKGTFNETGSDPAGWYWSSSPDHGLVLVQRFSDGTQSSTNTGDALSLRCVR